MLIPLTVTRLQLAFRKRKKNPKEVIFHSSWCGYLYLSTARWVSALCWKIQCVWTTRRYRRSLTWEKRANNGRLVRNLKLSGGTSCSTTHKVACKTRGLNLHWAFNPLRPRVQNLRPTILFTRRAHVRQNINYSARALLKPLCQLLWG